MLESVVRRPEPSLLLSSRLEPSSLRVVVVVHGTRRSSNKVIVVVVVVVGARRRNKSVRVSFRDNWKQKHRDVRLSATSVSVWWHLRLLVDQSGAVWD